METQVTVVEAAGNPIADLEIKIGGLKPRALMKETRKLEENWAKTYFELGCMLDRIKFGIKTKEAGFEAYKTFTDYVDAELRVGMAQANNFVKVYRTLKDKGIPFSKVASLPFSSLIAAVPVLSAEHVDAMVSQLSTMTYKQISQLPEVKAAKDPAKSQAGSKSVASKKANKAKATSPAADPDVIDVDHKDVAPAAGSLDIAALAESITEEQLTALFKALNRNKLVKAFNASGKKGVKLVLLGTPGPKPKTAVSQ